MSTEHFYAIAIIGGPILLAVVIIWAILNNRRSRRAEAQTEEATRDLYDTGATTEKKVD